MALVAIGILSMQSVLKSVCRHCGLDMVLGFPRSMAVLAVVLLIAHPILLALGQGSRDLINALDLSWYISVIWILALGGHSGQRRSALRWRGARAGAGRIAWERCGEAAVEQEDAAGEGTGGSEQGGGEDAHAGHEH